jgi:hypothetical protein
MALASFGSARRRRRVCGARWAVAMSWARKTADGRPVGSTAVPGPELIATKERPGCGGSAGVPICAGCAGRGHADGAGRDGVTLVIARI